MTLTPALGIDIGGTAIKMGIVARDGSIVARDTFPFDHDLSFDGVVARIAERAEALTARARKAPGRSGVAAPGFRRSTAGAFVRRHQHVPGDQNRALSVAVSSSWTSRRDRE